MGCCLSTEPGHGMNEAAADTDDKLHAQEALDILSGMQDCTSRIEIRLACKQLRNRDGITGKSDPFCVLYEKDTKSGQWVERGRTEVIVNNMSPEFVKGILVSYNFELAQMLRVAVFDADDTSHDVRSLVLDRQDKLGSCDFALADAARDTSKPLVLSLQGAGAQGTCVVSVEEVVDFKKALTVTMKAEGLANKDRFGKSDPFLQILRPKETAKGTKFQPVFQTSVIMNNLNPQWPRQEISLGRLCGGDLESPLLIRVLDWDSDGTHDDIGSVQLSVTGLLAAASTGAAVPLTSRKGRSGVGALRFEDAVVIETPSFLDCLRSGLEIDFSVAVDFTLSNGDPRNPQSLHYSQGGPTQYEQAIRGVGAVLDHYNQSQQYTAWSFGARVAKGPTSHCYPLNGNLQDPRVHGTQGIVDAYHGLLQHSSLSGPTNFAPVISTTLEAVRTFPKGKRYMCLLILTDGAITDMTETVSAIVAASREAMSIIIVGVGTADFTSMNKLDSDGVALVSFGGVAAERDIVQFVPFHEHRGNGTALAADVLAEFPGQVVAFVRKHGAVAGQGLAANSAPTLPTV